MSELQLQSCYTGYIGFLSREALVVKSLPLSLCFSLSLSLSLSIYIYPYHSGGKDSGRAMGHWSEIVKNQQLNIVQPNSKVVLSW